MVFSSFVCLAAFGVSHGMSTGTDDTGSFTWSIYKGDPLCGAATRALRETGLTFGASFPISIDEQFFFANPYSPEPTPTYKGIAKNANPQVGYVACVGEDLATTAASLAAASSITSPD